MSSTKPEQPKQPVPEPEHVGTSQPNQSSWGVGKPGEVLEPPEDALPEQPDEKK